MPANNRITANRLLAFVANEARELCMPGVMNVEQRYPLVKELSVIALKQYAYRRSDYALDREGQLQFDELVHFIHLLDALYAPQDKEALSQ